MSWDHGAAEIHPLGGMLGPVLFTLPDGRCVQPFFVAPWIGDASVPSLPPLLQGLRGEFPCVPFGAERDTPIPGWQGRAAAIGDGAAHGHSANHDWQLLDRGPDWIEIGIDYPAGHPVRRLRRRVSGRKGAAALDLMLEVEADRDIDLGIALHPTFRLPETAGATEIEVAGLIKGMVFPAPLDSTGRAAPGAAFARLDQVPGVDGAVIDFSRLPFAAPNEDLLQVQATGGAVRVVNRQEAWAAHVEYDPVQFPSVILWVSNRGWTGFPWSGRTRALGIEPARAAFDLGQTVSADPDNPLVRTGVPTFFHLKAGEVLRTKYVISVEGLS